MGFFSKLKELFNKNIECDEDMKNHIVLLLEKKKYLFLDKNIIVRDNTVCVVVYKSRVADVLLPGKYKINEQSIPETYSRAKIDKLSKKGPKIRKIKVDLYFVNTLFYQDLEFDSDEPFLIKSRELGRIKGYLKGLCTLRVIDPGLLVKCLIAEDGKEKNKDVLKDIGLWIGNKINKKIEKNKIDIQTIFNNNTYVNSMLNTDLEDAFDNIGVFVKNVKLKAVDFPKRYQKKINKKIELLNHNAKTAQVVDRNWVVGGRSQQSTPITIAQTRKANENNTMQNLNKSQQIGDYITCSTCGFKNRIGSKTCHNCGNKFD